jgi:lipid II:glycine glycyltransferase (peptidoglycan interpeptide bridge formation enzyme)
MRRKAGGHDARDEGQGEVIVKKSTAAPWCELTVSPAPLAALDASPELLQSGFWGHFKSAHAWTPRAFTVQAGDASFGLLVLTRRIARLFTIAYVPFGPSHDPGPGRGALLSALARALRPQLPRGALFLRYDLPWPRSGEAPNARGVRKSASDMQPASTVIVDIAPPLDDVLGSMKSKTRYNIRLAQKKGVQVVEGGPGDLDRWYTLYEETSRRDRIAIHSRGYYTGLMDAAQTYSGTRPRVALLLAMHEGALLAGNIVAFWKDRAAYLYGASSGEKRNLMPTYALQWEAIRRAKEAGCTSYDLFGVPPLPDPGHPMFGLYQFKTGFNETVFERWGTWDVPLRPVLYAAYRAAEAMRMFYYRTLKKKLRGRPRGNDS